MSSLSRCQLGFKVCVLMRRRRVLTHKADVTSSLEESSQRQTPAKSGGDREGGEMPSDRQI